MKSRVLNHDVTMKLHVPESFAISSKEHTYPVLFVHGAHGEQFFETVVGIVKHLASRERMPEVLVVSLNDIGEIPEVTTHGMWGREKIGGSGDASAHLRHLREEVFPYLEQNYRANHYRMIVGVSGSSLFPVFALTEATDLFESYILVAAADIVGMGYDEDSNFIDTFEKIFRTTPERRTKLYVGVADHDTENKPHHVENLEELKKRLGHLKGLDLKVEVVPDEDRYAVLIRSMLTAMTQNFPDKLWSSRYRELIAQPGDALENIDRHYQDLSKKYGFTILPRVDRWNNVNSLRSATRLLIQQDRPAEAHAVALRRIEYQPTVPGSHAGLADALESLGQLKAAVDAQKTAVDLAKRQGSEDLEALEQRLLELRAAQNDEETPPSD
ncbi:MAG: alpha/beta hydrolase-fold protein [Acidobacteriota bacterium]